jgi:2-polyprenyl-6-methoxyphenol hydroxylase-like FAD-dependent oxidoreductase
LTGGVSGRDIELPRGALTSSLYALTLDRAIRYRFNDSIDTLNDDGAGVDVRFKSGAQGRFDVVVGADSLHSNTRALVFGPETGFSRYLGFCFNLFSVPKDLGLSHEGVTYAEPGRMAGVDVVGDSDSLHAFLTFASVEPPFLSDPDVDKQRQRIAEVFAQGGWEVPRLVEAAAGKRVAKGRPLINIVSNSFTFPDRLTKVKGQPWQQRTTIARFG